MVTKRQEVREHPTFGSCSRDAAPHARNALEISRKLASTHTCNRHTELCSCNSAASIGGVPTGKGARKPLVATFLWHTVYIPTYVGSGRNGVESKDDDDDNCNRIRKSRRTD